MRLILAFLAAVLSAAPALAAPKVVASILPVHAIVAAVMGDTGKPTLLLKGALSEHRSSFTPSQFVTLGEADVVFIVGHGLEAKLAQLSGSEAVNGRIFIALSDAPDVTHLPVREGGGFEAHVHDAGEEGDHAEGVLSFDPHVWLDPENARAMAQAVAAELGRADPANAGTYAANAKAFTMSLDGLEQDLTAALAPVKNKPFIVFHDAYQYFEARFGLMAAGSITDVSARPPSAKRLADIRARLAESKAVCVFREPQYDGKAVAAVIEGSAAKEGVLDPVGASLAPGPDAYGQLLRQLATGFASCLGG